MIGMIGFGLEITYLFWLHYQFEALEDFVTFLYQSLK